MAFGTKCAACGGTTWEVKTIEPVGSNYKQNVLQCFSCGVPVAVMPFYDLGTMLMKQDKVLEALQKHAVQIQSDVREMKQLLHRR